MKTYLNPASIQDGSITREKLADNVFNEAGMSNLTHITHAKLLKLRNDGKLTPGMLYQIDDYETYIDPSIGGYTEIDSVWGRTDEHDADLGFTFHVIVLALTESLLSEDAWYYAGNTVNKIKYCLENDHEKFGWVPKNNAPRAIQYGLIDPSENEFFHDVDDHWRSRSDIKINYTPDWYNPGSDYDEGYNQFYWNAYGPKVVYDDETGEYLYENYALVHPEYTNIGDYVSMISLIETLSDPDNPYSQVYYNVSDFSFQPYVIENAEYPYKGIIYYMEDENNNSAPYDFKNIRFDQKFTFGGKRDLSKSIARNNSVAIEDNDDGQLFLPNNIIDVDNYIQRISNNKFGYDVYDCKILGIRSWDVSDNIINDNCYNCIISPSSYAQSSTSINYVAGNVIGSSSSNSEVRGYSNKIGTECSSNIIDGNFNTIGNNCSFNNLNIHDSIVEDHVSGLEIEYGQSLSQRYQDLHIMKGRYDGKLGDLIDLTDLGNINGSTIGKNSEGELKIFNICDLIK